MDRPDRPAQGAAAAEEELPAARPLMLLRLEQPLEEDGALRPGTEEWARALHAQRGGYLHGLRRHVKRGAVPALENDRASKRRLLQSAPFAPSVSACISPPNGFLSLA